MRIDVFTIFPRLVDEFCSASLLGRAREADLLELRTPRPARYTSDVHRTIDDSLFGGGAGMLMRPEPVFASVEAADPLRPLYLLGLGGQRFDQALADELAATGRIACCAVGTRGSIASASTSSTVSWSIGDIVLAGGEVAACLVVEAVTRLVPGVMGNESSPLTESFSRRGLLEEPQFTRPADFVVGPFQRSCAAVINGRIERWRRAQALHRTIARRPDLIEARGGVTPEEAQPEEFPALPYP